METSIATISAVTLLIKKETKGLNYMTIKLLNKKQCILKLLTNSSTHSKHTEMNNLIKTGKNIGGYNLPSFSHLRSWHHPCLPP